MAERPAQFPEENRFFRIVAGAFTQEVNSASHPVVPRSIIVEFDGNVVGEVPALELPDRNEVGLELCDLIKSGTQAIPIMIFFVPIRAFPQQICGDPLHAKSRELHGFAGRVDITKIRLGNFVFDSHLCEHTTLG